MVLLITADNEKFNIDHGVAERSWLIRRACEDWKEAESGIPLENVSSSILSRILEYCEHHKGEPIPPSCTETRERSTNDDRNYPFDEWDSAFIARADNDTLTAITAAAWYLDIRRLVDLGTQTISKRLIGKTPKEIREMFKIEGDFTPEVQAQPVRRIPH